MDDRDTTLTGLGIDAVAASEPVAQLHVVHPPELASRFTLGASSIVLGRSRQIGGHAIPHRTVSRRHARVDWQGGVHRVIDLGSRNGSRLNGAPLTESQALTDGAVVRLGDTIAIYELGEAAAAHGSVSEDALPGRALSVCRLRRQLEHAGPDPAPALLIGETGTGKEYLARELHRLSGRAGRFVAINCAALSAQLIESQLFGHVRGAFTGANTAAMGLFRDADRGTLFLDEIGDLPVELQPKLLRAIQEQEVLPVGATRPIAVNVRIVGATLHPLARRVESGLFRRDLYARLAAWSLAVPPLRARRSDLLDWVVRLHQAWQAQRPHRQPHALRLDVNAAERVLLHPWPANLRGLGHVVHRLAAADEPGVITGAQIKTLFEAAPPTPEATPAGSKEESRPSKPSAGALREALARLGSVRAVAKHYQRDRKQIYRWMDAYGIER